MKELFCQMQSNTLLPFSAEDKAVLSGFSDNQVLRVKVSGTTKQRSLTQLRTYWRACKKVAINTTDFRWNSKDKTDFQCRVALHFVDPSITVVRPDGQVVFRYRSISFVNLKHIEACRYFDRALEIMALKIGVEVEELYRESI